MAEHVVDQGVERSTEVIGGNADRAGRSGTSRRSETSGVVGENAPEPGPFGDHRDGVAAHRYDERGRGAGPRDGGVDGLDELVDVLGQARALLGVVQGLHVEAKRRDGRAQAVGQVGTQLTLVGEHLRDTGAEAVEDPPDRRDLAGPAGVTVASRSPEPTRSATSASSGTDRDSRLAIRSADQERSDEEHQTDDCQHGPGRVDTLAEQLVRDEGPDHDDPFGTTDGQQDLDTARGLGREGRPCSASSTLGVHGVGAPSTVPSGRKTVVRRAPVFTASSASLSRLRPAVLTSTVRP